MKDATVFTRQSLRADDIVLFTMSPKHNRNKETLHLGQVASTGSDTCFVKYRKRGSKRFTEAAIVPFSSVRRLVREYGYRPEGLLNKFNSLKDKRKTETRKRVARVVNVSGMAFKY